VPGLYRTSLGAAKFEVDQGAVWNAIDDLSQEAEVVSETGAMHDVYKSRDKDINSYLYRNFFFFVHDNFLSILSNFHPLSSCINNNT